MNIPASQGPFMKGHSPGNKGVHFMVISVYDIDKTVPVGLGNASHSFTSLSSF